MLRGKWGKRKMEHSRDVDKKLENKNSQFIMQLKSSQKSPEEAQNIVVLIKIVNSEQPNRQN